ncbi:MAG: TraB/GumN family protein [Clostridia bacterium]|nr:TraB/GumN family protein [Clostridia bacterium]
MKLKLFALLMAFIMTLSLVSCSLPGKSDGEKSDKKDKTTQSSDEDGKENENENENEREDGKYSIFEGGPIGSPLLYKVTDSDGGVVWLFGSIHAGRDSFYPLPDYVLDAYESSDALAVEFDIVDFESNYLEQLTSQVVLMYTGGKQITDVISDDLYDEAVEILSENGKYISGLEKYYPIMWSSMIDNCSNEEIGAEIDLGIDRHLINKAYDDGKEIIDVESALIQYKMFANFSEELQVFMLEDSIEKYRDIDSYEEAFDDMLDAWETGDAGGIMGEMEHDADFTDEEIELYEEYYAELITDRNETMTDFAVDMLESGDEVFICVGAAHVVGEGGIAAALYEMGYTVEIAK